MKKLVKRIKQIICRHTDCKYLYVDKSRRKVFYECKKCVKTISVHWMGPGRKTMKKYKIVKYDDRYYMTYKAVLYKEVKIWPFTFWMEWEVTKGKDWWVMSVINEWQNKFDVKGFEDRTEI